MSYRFAPRRVAGPPVPMVALAFVVATWWSRTGTFDGGVPGSACVPVRLPLPRADVGDDDGDPSGRFDIGLVGDWGYTPQERERLPRLIDAMNSAGLAFSVHDGDTGVPPRSCTGAADVETRALFDRFRHPLVYTPGDNEWTDCWRSGADPLERLASLRRTFFRDDRSRGAVRMPLVRQSSQYPENVRWSRAGVTFAAIHIVGSNNGLPDHERPGNRRESAARTSAAKMWTRAAFAHARAADSPAVAVFIHGDPRFELPHGQRWGYDDFLQALEREVVGFGRPVLLVHGDRHEYRRDKPFVTYRQPRRRLENLIRVETFGPKDLAWVRVRIRPDSPWVFEIRPERVAPAPP